ncbi:LOW QUALITY PROTEIN: hypothetical protein MAR_027661 [Mya arenaria]|uniref:Uncharacterized protein n=1 Tax=Mya arenaria TaxID=6604 RepID=A0ABY7F2B3_MYAAR|nr:LOW QUALITY PROTEIN: hypothetical protein MAR_027661 [Mya arenaria]
MWMSFEMFDELLERVGPRISKRHTWYRMLLEPGIFSWFCASPSFGKNSAWMKFGWRLPHNTQLYLVHVFMDTGLTYFSDELFICPITFYE